MPKRILMIIIIAPNLVLILNGEFTRHLCIYGSEAFFLEPKVQRLYHFHTRRVYTKSANSVRMYARINESFNLGLGLQTNTPPDPYYGRIGSRVSKVVHSDKWIQPCDQAQGLLRIRIRSS